MNNIVQDTIEGIAKKIQEKMSQKNISIEKAIEIVKEDEGINQSISDLDCLINEFLNELIDFNVNQKDLETYTEKFLQINNDNINIGIL